MTATPRLSARERTAAAVAFVLVLGLLVAGWKLFWFLCDDAYIAFRYVGNSILGHGYTWNPPPFRPVEGYTSFLWVVILDGVWRLTGVEPPQSANALSLAAAAGSVGLVGWWGLRAPWPAALVPHRVALTALVLLGTVTNRTFLAWTSSGLETSLFTLLVLGWSAIGFLAPRGRGGVAGLAALAGLIALCRPDGLLFVAATAGYGMFWLFRSGRPAIADGLAALPLAVPAAHLLWRHATYGFWVPNTWFVKGTHAWPEAGGRYVASFLLEYGLWLWVLVALGGALGSLRALRSAPRLGLAGLMRVGVVATLSGQALYYTLQVGGDHFEYRIFHHLVPLTLLALPALWARWGIASRLAPAVLALQILLGLPIPWLHWQLSQEADTRDESIEMVVPVAPHLPGIVRPYGALFDRLQEWLIVRQIGARHQEHKVFGQHQRQRYPDREVGLAMATRGIPVVVRKSVGVLAWVLPHVAVIDALGLNDLVVARAPRRSDGRRRMAHDLTPPDGYTECFRPNVGFRADRTIKLTRRKPALTAADVIRCEDDFLRQALVQRYADRLTLPPRP